MAKINVIYSLWGIGAVDDEPGIVLSGGEQEVEIVAAIGDGGVAVAGDAETETLAQLPADHLAAGEAAGVVEIVDATDEERALLDGHVQSQEDGERAYLDAQDSGDWHEGHHFQWAVDTEHRLMLENDEANLTDGGRDFLTDSLGKMYAARGAEWRDSVKAALQSPEDVREAMRQSIAEATGENGSTPYPALYAGDPGTGPEPAESAETETEEER